jgi:general secretion pathway protein B
MSYILDALNKSEQERNRGKPPTIDSLKDVEISRRISLKQFFVGLVLLALLNSFGVYLYFGRDTVLSKVSEPVATRHTDLERQPSDNPGLAKPRLETNIALRHEPRHPGAEDLQPGRSARDSNTIEQPGRSVIANQDASVIDQQVEANRRGEANQQVEFKHLPTNVQARASALEVTAHIYSSDPQLRLVKVNNVTQYEGDQIPVGFRLVSITETGLILDFERYRFNLDVLDNWQQ